jgi:hypothetical protein
MHTTHTTFQCYSHLGHQPNVALLLAFYNPFVTRFWMLHLCCFSPTSFIVDAKMHLQQEVIEGQCQCCKYFMFVMTIPQRHCVLLHSRNHRKKQLEQKMGESLWCFVVSWTMVQSYKVGNYYNKILVKVVAWERQKQCYIQSWWLV